jgi:hypothetical protein
MSPPGRSGMRIVAKGRREERDIFLLHPDIIDWKMVGWVSMSGEENDRKEKNGK